MKKFALSILATMTLSSVVFAAAPNNGYYSSQHPLANATATRMFPPTDINIINATNNVIYVAAPVNDAVYPQNSDHIRHSSNYGSTYIVLQDPYHVTFWQGNVCRLAVVTVFGGPGMYTTKVDNELCN